MGEETNFWGIATSRRRDETRLFSWRATAPGAKTFRFYFVFSSRERAEKFVREHGEKLMVEVPQLVEDLLENIRPIERDEIPEEHYVLSDCKGLVTWAKLLGEGE